MTIVKKMIVFLDIDGTLSIGNNPPSDQMLEAIPLLRQKGHKVFPCTGRPLHSINKRLLDAGVDGIIALAGAYVQVGDKILTDKIISPDMVRRMLQIFEEEDIYSMMEENGKNIYFSPGGKMLLEKPTSFQSSAELERAHPELRVAKLVISRDDGPRLMKYHSVFKETLTISDTNMGWIEIGPKGINKATAIHKVVGYYGWELSDTFAIGDSENDVEMLDTVGTAVAMGNAMDSVKAHADYITSAVEADGAYLALVHFGFLKS